YEKHQLNAVEKSFCECLTLFRSKNYKEKENGLVLVQMIEDYEYTIKFAAAAKVLSEKNNLGVYSYDVLIDGITGKISKKPGYEKLIQKKLSKIYSSFVADVLFHNESKFNDQAFIEKELIKIGENLDINDPASLLKLKFDGVLVGDLIYDTYLRFFHQPTIEKIDKNIMHIIEVALNVFYNFKLFLKNNNVRALLNSYSSYIHHGIPARICLHNNIDVYTVGSNSYIIQKLSVDFPYHQINHTSFSPGKPLSEEQLELAKNIFTSRFKGKIDPATSYMRQSAFSDKPLSASVKKLFSEKNRNIVIYAHDFYDSPHVNRLLQFPDLYQFLKQTLEALTDLETTNVFIKTHPNGIAGCKEKTIELVNSFNKPHFHILDESVSNLHIVELKPALIATARGTVCVEMAYFNIPTVALYDNLYVNFDFVHSCKNTESYFSVLKGKEQPVIDFDKQKIYSFYYQAFLEQTIRNQDGVFELLCSFNGNTYNDKYLQVIVANKTKIFNTHFPEYYSKKIFS
ncbi:MAG: hypothetical protein ACXVNQ_11360, partial [Bacteroidia bacterium]